PLRFMVDSGEGRDHDSPERILARRGASEFIGMVFHGYTITHVDTPAHYFWQGKIYNGRSCNLITSREGAQVESVDLLRDGVVGMGLWLIDNANLEELAKACSARKRWEFMLTVAPLRLQGVTGSPVNPIALF